MKKMREAEKKFHNNSIDSLISKKKTILYDVLQNTLRYDIASNRNFSQRNSPQK